MNFKKYYCNEQYKLKEKYKYHFKIKFHRYIYNRQYYTLNRYNVKLSRMKNSFALFQSIRNYDYKRLHQNTLQYKKH